MRLPCNRWSKINGQLRRLVETAGSRDTRAEELTCEATLPLMIVISRDE